MGKTIDNILGKFEKITEPWIIGIVYAKCLGRSLRRTINPNSSYNQDNNYNLNKPQSDYRK